MSAGASADAIRVLLVDDQELIRTGFSLILSTANGGEPGIEVVGEAADGAEALAIIEQLHAHHCPPHVVLMDVRMPGMDGIEATQRITEQFPDTRVLVLTTFDLDEYALAAIEAGASGFLLKDARAPELISAVRAVADGDSVMAPKVTMRLISRLRGNVSSAALGEGTGSVQTVLDEPSSLLIPGHGEGHAVHNDTRISMLTEREREVFGLIAEGLSNAEIGERLFLSESTIKTHVGRVLTKLELRDRVHAVILAYEIGIR